MGFSKNPTFHHLNPFLFSLSRRVHPRLNDSVGQTGGQNRRGDGVFRNALMLKLHLTLFFLICFFGEVSAQFTTKSIQLKPIGKSGWKYFYGTKKVNNAFSLQIPLEGINHPEVNRYFKNFKVMQNLRALAYIPSFIFLFTMSNGTQQDAVTFSYLFLGGVAVDITGNIISQNQIGKAIDIYNISITQSSSIGLQIEKIKSNQTLISFGVRQRF